MKIGSFEFRDACTELQDDVLDAQFEWLKGMPVSDEMRREIFDHLCVATGTLLNRVIALGGPQEE